MRLLLIRHGQTPANVGGVLSTAVPGPGLTRLGVEQADALADALAGEGIEALFVSGLRRTHLTAAPLANALGLVPTRLEGVNEIEAGDLEDADDVEAYDRYIAPVHDWVAGDLEARIPGGPTGHDFFSRFDAAIEIVAATGVSVAAVVSHGAAIRVWSTARGENTDLAFLRDRSLDNTGVVILEGSPRGGWHVVGWEGEPVGGAALHDEAANDPTGRG